MQKQSKTGFACDIIFPSEQGRTRLILSVELKGGKIITRRCNVGLVGTNRLGAWGTVTHADVDKNGAQFTAVGFAGGDEAKDQPQVVIQGYVMPEAVTISVVRIDASALISAEDAKIEAGRVNLFPAA